MKAIKPNQTLLIKTTSNFAYLAMSSFMVGSAAFLFGLIYGLVCPAVQPEQSSAEESSTTANTELTASIDSIITISAPESASMTISPDFSNSVFSTATATVSVTTNSAWGYSLSMGTSGTDASGAVTTDLVNSTNSSYTISNLTSSTTQANFTDNSWGFTTNNTGTDTTLGQVTSGTYYPLTTSSSPTLIKATEETTSGDTTTVTFAAQVNSNQPSGKYTNTVIFSAVANPEKLTIFDIDNMQEMTADVCSNTTTPLSTSTEYDTDGSYKGNTAYVPQTTLIDTRDNTEYTIVKLADGNCWMQENLALGTSDSAGLTLTSETSDVSSDWTLPAYDTKGTTWDSGTNDAHTIQGSTTNSSSWVDGMGNWYTWGAATAGTASSATTSQAEASDSICPKGWQLPLGGSQSAWGSTTSKSFGYLFAAYSLTSSSSDTSTAIRSAPLSFTYSGWYRYSNGSIYYVGSYGGYWSSTARSSAYAYYLTFYSSRVDPQDYDADRGRGLSIRCVAQ